jgi:regulatory protein
MLARRELSEAQVRRRLAARDHDDNAINAAIEQLRAERAIDDDRVAGAIARTEAGVKRRGRLRVRREIERAGIAPAVARRAVDNAFGAIDANDHIDAALARRLKGSKIKDAAEFRRLYRFLIGQGFEADQVVAALKRKSH